MVASLIFGFIALGFVLPLFCKFVETFVRRRYTIEDLAKKSIIITGCDSGFGRLLALRMVTMGMPTFAACKTEEGVKSLRRLLTSVSPESIERTWVFQLDVTSQSSVEEAYQFVKNNLGSSKLWALVNNAGILGAALPDEWLTVDDYRHTMEVNFLGQIRMAQKFRPMLEKSHGRMIFMSSVFGRVSVPLLGPYQTTKHALDSYVDMLRQEMLCRNVFVSIMEPGFFETCLTNGNDPLQLCVKQGRLREEEAAEIDAYGSHKNFLTRFCSKKTDMVTNAYQEAITSKYPRYRYTVGLDAILFWMPFAYLPTWLALRMSAFTTKLFNVNSILEKRRVRSP
uniref:Uncharacterized protein n=1 Tax=Trichuris muris TaxID=70415 RepID=A0A5S6QYC3_TRIMR